MSQTPPATISETEPGVYARSIGGAPAPSAAPAVKLRSCVTCRSRKVRCDKQSPCSNCRRANITCVVSSSDRPPRWARRLHNAVPTRATVTNPQVDHVMERIQDLENLVKGLASQLGHMQKDTNSGTSDANRNTEAGEDISPPTRGTNTTAPNQFGRLVHQDSSQSHYISSGFWSRVGYELDELKLQTNGMASRNSDASDDDVLVEKGTDLAGTRTPLERHAFLFARDLGRSDTDIKDFRPLPSQVPFLLDVFSENVNSLLQIVHMPTLNKMVRSFRANDMTAFTPANEALLFSIYYSAVSSMDSGDVMINFGLTKADLLSKFRLGLEYALAKADFLSAPNLVLVQAFTLFLFLLRLDESPGFVWMMTGLAIRMAQWIGLQRDGTSFPHLKPYDVEMRRRVWWAVCMLDIRASENQGTDMTIANNSFDTKLPLNINDEDITPDSDQSPPEREGITDMFFARISYELCGTMRQMTSLFAKDGPPNLEEQSNMISELYNIVERNQSKYWTESTRIPFAVCAICARLVMAKMTLLIYHPTLFFSQSEIHSSEIRAKLFTAAIEVAEFNHILNSEPQYRQWRWCYLTYTHWYSIVYLVLEILRRPWSPTVERAWVALHSSWLIPSKFYTDKNVRIWVPLRKLMSRANQHRNAELERLRNNPEAARQAEQEEEKIPVPTSSGPFPVGTDVVGIYLERWRQLVNMPEHQDRPELSDARVSSGFVHRNANPTQEHTVTTAASKGNLEAPYHSSSGLHGNQNLLGGDLMNFEPTMSTSTLLPREGVGTSNHAYQEVPNDWLYDQNMADGFVAWPFVDNDSPADLDSEMNWYNWIESARNMELEAPNRLP